MTSGVPPVFVTVSVIDGVVWRSTLPKLTVLGLRLSDVTLLRMMPGYPIAQHGPTQLTAASAWFVPVRLTLKLLGVAGKVNNEPHSPTPTHPVPVQLTPRRSLLLGAPL